MVQALCMSLLVGLSLIPFWGSHFFPSQASTAGQAQVPVISTAPTTPSSASAKPSITPPHPVDEAANLYRKGNFDAAIQKYQAIIEGKTDLAQAYAGLTRVYLKKRDVAQANATIEKGLQAADSPVVRVALGEVYFRQGKIHEAEQEWISVVNSGHQEARAYLGLGRVRWALSLYKSSWDMLDKAYALDPTDPEIRRRWVGKLTRSERIKYLEDYLSNETNDDAETRTSLQHYLEYLKARAKDPHGTCHLVSKTTTTDTNLIPFMIDLKHLRGFGLSVTVNEQKSRLLLDTGASGILINRNLAEKAGVTKLSAMDVSGIGDRGNRGGYMSIANSLKIGELEFQGCTVRVIDQRSVVGEDGVIGADVFAPFLVDIDFPNEKLHLRELPKRPEQQAPQITLQSEKDDSNAGEESESGEKPENGTDSKKPGRPHFDPHDRYIAPEMKSYTQIYRFGHALLVPTLIDGLPPKQFLLDTGSFSNLVSPVAASEVTKVHSDSHTIIKGINGSVKNVYRADKAILQFGHLRQENQDLLGFDLTSTSDKFGTEISGILGFATLRMLDVKIDYRDGLVDFTYDAKSGH
jgi:tetratricopeptide (TPR) repeat protein/predicted aspartyl protease